MSERVLASCDFQVGRERIDYRLMRAQNGELVCVRRVRQPDRSVVETSMAIGSIEQLSRFMRGDKSYAQFAKHEKRFIAIARNHVTSEHST